MIRRLGRRSHLMTELTAHAHRPFQVAGTVVAVQFAVRWTTGYAVGTGWRQAVLHILVLGVVAAMAWLVAALLVVAEDTALARFRGSTCPTTGTPAGCGPRWCCCAG